MAILVTGATGFVMANLVRHLAESGHDVVAADLVAPDDPMKRFLSGHRGGVTFERLDVTDRAGVRALFERIHPERTVHGAAITSVPPEAERDRFLATVDVNVIGTLNVLDALRARGSQLGGPRATAAPTAAIAPAPSRPDSGGISGRVIVVSSGSVYGPRTDAAPIREDDDKRAEHVYPLTKWAADALARRFAEVRGMDLAVVRLASPFGPFERDTGSRPLLSPMQRWIAAARRGETVRVGGSPTAARDAVYAADVASGIAAVLLADRLPHDAYNVGWGRNTTSEEAARAIAKALPGARVEFDPAEPYPWGGARGPLSIERLRSDLGWAPRHDLESGIRAYLDWLRAESVVVGGRQAVPPHSGTAR